MEREMMRASRLAPLLLSILTAGQLLAAQQGGSIPVPLPLFPPNNWWNTDISAAPLDPSSANFISFIGPTKGLHPDFGGDAGGGNVYGFPYILVDGAQTKRTVTFVDYPEQSDGVGVPFYPIPDEAITMSGWVEGGQPGNVDQRSTGDRHLLVVDTTNNKLYELYNVWFNGTVWEAASGAYFDMNSNNRRPDTWTSADAAGLAILPGLVRYDEVSGPDEIRHAFRVTVRATNGSVYPASHSAGSTAGAAPMGMRLRLKASKDISTFPAQVQKIFRAFKKYGLIVADNGSDLYVSGNYDVHWDNDVLNPAFGALKASDFEVIQRGWAPPVSLVLIMPGVLGAGDPASATLTAYDSNSNLATGYSGTVHFTSTDGAATLPVDYTFLPADGGSHTFPSGFTLRTAGSHVVTVTDIANVPITGSRGVSVGPPAPVGLAASASAPTQISLTWSASPGATQYQVFRASSSGLYASLATTASTGYSDSAVSAGAAYVYKVRASDASARLSPFSAPDAAITTFFTDDPLVASATAVKVVHLSELRAAVNALRAAAGLGAASFTDPFLSGLPIKAVHLQELRTALSEARAPLGLGAVSLTDPTLASGVTRVKAAHVQELRDGVK